MYHINSFAVIGSSCYAGDKEGNIIHLNVDDMSLIKDYKLHNGTIQAIASHCNKPYIATLGKDFFVYILSCENDIKPIARIFYRDLTPEKFTRPIVHNEGQGICFNSNSEEVFFVTPRNFIVRVTMIGEVIAVFGEEVHHAIVTLRVYKKFLLAGTNRGEIYIYNLESNQLFTSVKFTESNETIHWFEHIENDQFVAASDARRLFKFHLNNPINYEYSEEVSHDDLEHVTYNKQTKQLIASSFDKKLYNIDLNTLAVKSVLAHLPFKIRWIRHINDQNVLAQVRDGSLYKINIETGKKQTLKSGGDFCIWSSCVNLNNHSIYLGGDCNRVLKFNFKVNQLIFNHAEVCVKGTSYYKRVVSYKNDLICGSTDGVIYIFDQCKLRLIKTVGIGSVVRDICVGHDQLFVACENYTLFVVCLKKRSIISKFILNAPLWSLAYSHTYSFIAVAERVGNLYVFTLNHNNNLIEVAKTSSYLPKRMKWHGHDLLVTRSSSIDRIQYINGEWHHNQDEFEIGKNTVEDYLITQDSKYLIAITYAKRIFLIDYQNGTVLDECYDNLDYSKGLLHLSEDGYTFLVYGRYKQLKIMQIHDEQLVPRHIEVLHD
ncbi:WD40 repeat domain-containing protein [Fastidiosibacter lacustris]|uniref:WD40 repeat domain-containing protein n=1 Tax=Fastidiosibacter lacustris TaxID=2056695 RepID=UPI000E3531F2|nr:WD40 repeat domain-containing protein [Fastidiosibacter lacustris]